MYPYLGCWENSYIQGVPVFLVRIVNFKFLAVRVRLNVSCFFVTG
jgi:hypothetical protein